MKRPFLIARWERVALLSYVVPPEVLTPHLPPGLTLDTRDGHAFASLVAFDFLDTRVLGVPWPGFRDFPEVNVRFYVRHGAERGVVFVRELVPQRLVAWVARTVYNEPYVATPMQNIRDETPERLTLTLEEHNRVFRMDDDQSTYLLESLLNMGLIEPASPEARRDASGNPTRIIAGERYRLHPLILHPTFQLLKERNIIH